MINLTNKIPNYIHYSKNYEWYEENGEIFNLKNTKSYTKKCFKNF